jgi:hypothetical protein
MERCMMKTKQLPGYFWGEVVTTAVHILNRSPTRAVNGKTPYEAWHGRAPAMHYLRTFGCVAHVKITRPGLKKLDDRSMKAVFIGYEPGSKAYRCYDPVSKRVIISRDVVFDEAAAWRWCDTNGEQQEMGEPFTVEYNTKLVRDVVPATPTPPPAGVPATPTAEIDDDDLDAEHDNTPLRLHPINDLIGDAAPLGLARRVFNVELNFTSADETTSFHEEEREESWRQAMIEEIKSIEDNNTWELTSLLAGHRAIRLKWVYKVKPDEADNIVRHKARLVAKGYVQCGGIDFDEVFAPVA